MMHVRRKLIAAASSLAVLSAVLLAGCAPSSTSETGEQIASLAETGILTLSVNPEIRIEYNKEGKVVDLTGINTDGEAIVSSYQDYIGKDCEIVLTDLVQKINDAGYFVEEIDGNPRNIVIQIEPGSILPSDDFVQQISQSTQEAVANLSLASDIVTIDKDDYDPQYAQDSTPSPYITLAKAQEIALAQANVNAADAVFDDREFDLDDGTPIYELEFMASGYEYEYDVDAVTGQILKAEHNMPVTQPATQPANYNDTDYGPNNDGVTDYNDTDYGPNNDGVTDYNDTDYGPNNDGVTDYNDTDYGPNNDGVTDYDDTDYGPNNDGVTDYNDTDYGPNNDGVTDYNDSNYGDTNYDDGGSNYSSSDYGDSGYDD